jgi:hypothetical protein
MLAPRGEIFVECALQWGLALSAPVASMYDTPVISPLWAGNCRWAGTYALKKRAPEG